MIKIIKPGQKEFHGFCMWCGCEFTYEISDLKLSATSDRVSCPTCGKDYHHIMQQAQQLIQPSIQRGLGDLSWPPDPIPCTDQAKDPCAECDWMKTLLKNGTYVGDTPCTWCPKNKFSCNTSGGSIVQSGSYPEAHLTDCNCGPNAVCSKCSGTSGTITTASNTDTYSTTSKEQSNTTKAVDCLCQGDVWKTIQTCCSDSCDGTCCENSAHDESEHECTCKHTNKG